VGQRPAMRSGEEMMQFRSLQDSLLEQKSYRGRVEILALPTAANLNWLSASRDV